MAVLCSDEEAMGIAALILKHYPRAVHGLFATEDCIEHGDAWVVWSLPSRHDGGDIDGGIVVFGMTVVQGANVLQTLIDHHGMSTQTSFEQ